jgi:hypothetical protein
VSPSSFEASVHEGPLPTVWNRPLTKAGHTAAKREFKRKLISQLHKTIDP